MVTLYAIDCLPNGMVNPIFTLTSGALGGLLAAGTLEARCSAVKHNRPRPGPVGGRTAVSAPEPKATAVSPMGEAFRR